MPYDLRLLMSEATTMSGTSPEVNASRVSFYVNEALRDPQILKSLANLQAEPVGDVLEQLSRALRVRHRTPTSRAQPSTP